MKLAISLLAGCVLILSACGNHSPAPSSPDEPAASSRTGDTSHQKFFPIADYLRSEIRYVDSTPLALLKKVTIGNRTDSSFIKPEEFHRLADAFLLPELRNLEKDYTESSFGDNTTGYLNFAYSPKDKEQPLHRVDVVVAPGEGFDKVKSIYLEKTFRQSDTIVTNKMYWQARHSFLVITNLQPPGKPAGNRQLQVVWNSEETD